MELLFQIKLPAILNNLSGLTGPVLERAKKQGLDDGKIMKIDLSLEEILVNIINYSFAESDAVGEIEVHCGIEAAKTGQIFIVEIFDSGKAFDVTEKESPDVSAGIDERGIGGLGIYLVKNSMDMVEYRRENDKNILRLGINI